MQTVHLATLMREWTWEPGVVMPIVLVVIWYAVGRRRLIQARAHNAAPGARRAVCYWAGVGTLVIALMSPLDAVADEIFSGHMVQHLLLILAAAPLFVLAAPLPELWWGIPDGPRHALARWWRRKARVRRAWMLLTAPGVVFVLHGAAIWFWHFRGPYEAALHNDALHALEHLSFLGTALLFWWIVIQPVGHRRLAFPAAVLYVVGTMLYGGALGGVLMYASNAWYPSHAAGAAAWGMTPLEDQQLAGLIMWIPAGLVYITTAVWLAWRWIAEDGSSLPEFHRQPEERSDEGPLSAEENQGLLLGAQGSFAPLRGAQDDKRSFGR